MSGTPHYITIYEGIAIHAARRASRVGGGVRLWAMAKALDTQGLGKIRRDDLKKFFLSTGENVRNYYRWLNEARNNDLMEDRQSKAGEWFLLLPSPAKVGLALGLDSIGTRKISIPVDVLITHGWKAHVEAGFEDGKQLTRERIQKEHNIPLSTQRYRAAQAGTIRTRNYAKSNRINRRTDPGKIIAGIKENTPHKAPFVMRSGHIAWRLPDLRHATKASRGRRGRARKVNAEIRQSKATQNALSYMRQGLSNESPNSEYIRLFNNTPQQLRQTERRIEKSRLTPPADLYERLETAKTGAVIWRHFPTR